MSRTFDIDGPGGPDAAGEAPDWTVAADGRYVAAGVELGRGGIGRVVVARDTSLDREVAIKQLLGTPGGSLDTSARSARFAREARVTASLEHPGIVPVYDAGVDAHGEPFYVMRRIRGRTLADALAGCRTLADRLRLLPHVVDLAQTVAYAHSRGVVHRDLKPANTMIGDFGETVVLDWGSARVAGAPATSSSFRRAEEGGATTSTHTMAGTLVGTPAYMSPEQARGEVDRTGVASDVWCLGVILFEVLAGRTPLDGLPTGEVLARVAAGRIPRIRDVTRDPVPPELAAVAEKALRPDPAARYASADAIARDVEAWRNGERVDAYAYGTGELVRRLVSRHRRAVALGLLAAACAVAGVVTWSISVGAERRRALDAEARSTAHLADALAALALGAEERRDHHAARLLSTEILRYREDPRARGWLVAFPSMGPPLRRPLGAGVEGCVTLAWSADGARLACGAPGEARVFEVGAADPGPPAVITDYEGVPSLAFAGDGLVVRDRTGRTELVDPRDGTRRWSGRWEGPMALAASADRVVVAEGARGLEVVRLLAAADGAPVDALSLPEGAATRCLALSAAGEVGVGLNAGVLAWRPGEGTRDSDRRLASTACAWAEDGWLAVGTEQGTVFRVEDGKARQVLPQVIGSGGITDVSVPAGGRWIALNTERGLHQTFLVATGTLLGSTLGDGGRGRLDGQGRWLATTSGGVLRLWDLAAETPATLEGPHQVKVFDALRGSEVRGWPRDPFPPFAFDARAVGASELVDLRKVAQSPTMVAWRREGQPDVVVRDLLGGTEWTVAAWPELQGSVDVDPTGRRIAGFLPDGTLWTGDGAIAGADPDALVRFVAGEAWLFPPGADPRPAARPEATVRLARPWAGCVLPTPDRERLMVGAEGGGVDVYRAADLAAGGAPSPVLRLEGPACARMAVSPDGALLAVVPADPEIHLWDLRDGRLLARLPRQSMDVTAVGFTRDGGALVVQDTYVRVMPLDPLRAPVEALLEAAREEAGARVDGSTLVVDRG